MNKRLFYPANIRFPMERANAVQILSMARAFARAGASVRLAVRRMDRRSDAECLAFYGLEAQPGLELVRYRVLNTHRSDLLWDLSYHAAMGADLLRQLLFRRVDVLYCRSLGIAGLGLSLKRLFPGLKVAMEVHTLSEVHARFNQEAFSDGSDLGRRAGRMAERESRVVSRADLLVPITKGLEEDLLSIGANPERLLLAPDGVDPERWAPSGDWPQAGPLLYAGHLYPWKGADLLTEILALLPGEEMVVAGGTPHEGDLERLKARAASAGLGGRMRFLGFVEPARMPDLLRTGAVGLIPLPDNPFARRFTSPLKLFEYMAAGLPIVASDLPSVREILRDGENALLVPPGDASGFAAAVRRLRTDPALARRLRTQALSDVQAYAWERRAKRILEALS